jgi:hypothetical protein
MWDPKRLNEERTPPPPTGCPQCDQPFRPDDQIVLDTDPTLAVTTYWHRECMTRYVEKRMAEDEQQKKQAAQRDPVFARILAALRGEH